MPRYTDIDKLIAEYDRVHVGPAGGARKLMVEAPIADVAPRAEVFEEVDKFRADLMAKFIDLCRGNDYNKLTLLKIGDVVDEMYDRRIAELKKKYTEARNER